MAGIKINSLPAVTSALLTDVFPVDQGATTYKETNLQVMTLFEANIVITPSNFSGVLPIDKGGTAASSFTPYSVICAGTTATGALQNTVGAGLAGQILRSGGAAALPAWSTATYPVTAGTSGNVLTSDGTNWVSSSASQQITNFTETFLLGGM